MYRNRLRSWRPRSLRSPFSEANGVRRLLVIVFCLFPLLGLGKTLSVSAQTEAHVSLTARLGFDGYCKVTSWLPIHVEVENTGPDLDASLQVSYQNDRGGSTVTRTDVLLPTKSRKEVFLYIHPHDFARKMVVSLTAGKQVLKEINLSLNCISDDNMLFGVLAENPSTYDILSNVKPVSGFARVAQLTISDLPENSQAWDSLDALVVSNVDTGKLTPEQKQALRSWLGMGGKLVVFGGLKWQGTAAGLKDFLPVDLTTTVNVADLSELQAYTRATRPLEGETTVATGGLRTDADILVKQDQIPILVQKQIGAGTVYYFAADPALQPLREWSGMEPLYDNLLGFRVAPPLWADAESINYDYARQALSTLPELGVPSIFYICGLLAFYIVIIGPINYFVLRRMKRRELAWVTIPVLVLIFTVLAYSTGLLYRGGTPTLNRLAFVQAADGVDRAHALSLTGIYSPVRARYDLEAAGNLAMSPAIGEQNLQANNNWTALLQGTKTILPDVGIEIGGMKSVTFEGDIPALDISHNLVMNVDRTTQTLSGNISNKSTYTLRDAFIVTPGQWTRLGDIAPGATPAINLSLANGFRGPDFYTLRAMEILNISYPFLETNKEAARRNALLDAALVAGYGSNEGNWGIYLMGWIDEPMIPISLQNRSFKTIDTTLYIHRLSPSVSIGRGEVTLPASLFAWEASMPNASPYHVSGLPSGSYVLRFRPAFPIQFREVINLQLLLRSNALPGDVIASVWDYEQNTWTPLQSPGGQTSIPNADRHIGPGNEIRIKVTSNRSDWTEITASYITMMVQP